MAEADRDSRDKADFRSVCFASSTAVAFDFASDLAAHSRSSSDQSLGSNKPSTDCFADRTSRAAVAWAVESLEGLRNDSEMESCDH